MTEHFPSPSWTDSSPGGRVKGENQKTRSCLTPCSVCGPPCTASLQPSPGPASSSATWGLEEIHLLCWQSAKPEWEQIFLLPTFYCCRFSSARTSAIHRLWHRVGMHTWEQALRVFSEQCFLLSLIVSLGHSFPRCAGACSLTKNSSELVGLLSFPPSLLCTTCYCWQTRPEWCNPFQILHHHSDARHCVGSCCLLPCVSLLNFLFLKDLKFDPRLSFCFWAFLLESSEISALAPELDYCPSYFTSSWAR